MAGKKTTPKKKGNATKAVAWILGGAVVLGGGYLIYDAAAKPGKPDPAPDTNDGGGGSAVDNTLPQGKFPLKRGDRNRLVQQLQEAIAKGSNTRAAELIKSNSIRRDGSGDGIFGDGLRRALEALNMPGSEVSQANFNSITGNNPTSSNDQQLPSGTLPLKFGDKNKLVKQFQEALTKHSNQKVRQAIASSIRSNGTGDGVFGNGMAEALNQLGLPRGEVSQQNFERIAGKPLNGVVIRANTVANQDTVITTGSQSQKRVKRGTILGLKVTDNNGITQILTVDNRLVYADSKHIRQVV
jgi:hypothetical protein